MNTGLFDRVKLFIKKIDPSSWPAFIMFAVVLIAAGALNYHGMEPVNGSFIAVAVSMFFGFGVLSWHIVESRTDDSKFQEDVAQSVKWINVILDGLLLVINLFRAQLHQVVFDGLTQWDTSAYLIVGVSAASHVIGFLLWTQNDPKRITRKELERGLSDITHRSDRANIAIEKTSLELKKRKWIEDRATELRKEYANVPGVSVDSMIAEMRRNALKEFQQEQAADDGKAKKQQQVAPLRPINQNAAETDAPKDFTDRQSRK